jgi:exopolysaccharide biosynthesis polyprenyl glycosylphosphotransferase
MEAAFDSPLEVSASPCSAAATPLAPHVEDLHVSRIEDPAFTGFRRIVKDAFDRIVAGLVLVMAAPLLIAVAIAVRLDSPGPVLYRQRRVGHHGQTFEMLKFRTMAADHAADATSLSSHNERDGPLFKIRRDPRVTRLGRVLRRYSLDELPQLWNVLTGPMSLVGPRPALPSEVELYDARASRRLLVKPGMTGLWQVSGRADLGWEESLRLDLRYVDNWCLMLDVLLLLRTVRAVVQARGAY